MPEIAESVPRSRLEPLHQLAEVPPIRTKQLGQSGALTPSGAKPEFMSPGTLVPAAYFIQPTRLGKIGSCETVKTQPSDGTMGSPDVMNRLVTSIRWYPDGLVITSSPSRAPAIGGAAPTPINTVRVVVPISRVAAIDWPVE